MAKLPATKFEVLADGTACDRVRLDAERKLWISTDGCTLAVVPAETERSDISGVLPYRTVASVRKNGKSINLSTLPEPKEPLTFPKWEAIVPKVKGSPTIAISFDMMRRWIDTFGSSGASGLVLWFAAPDKPFLMTTYEGDAWGVAMGMRLRDHRIPELAQRKKKAKAAKP